MTACDLLLNLPFLLKVIDGAVNGTGKLVCVRGQYMQEFNTEFFSSSSFISVYPTTSRLILVKFCTAS